MLLVLYYCMSSSSFLASGCWRIYHILPSCDTYGFLPSLLCCPWLYVLPANSMYQKLQVFCRKKENYNYKTKMVVYQRLETGLGEIGFHQLCCKECFYTCIKVVEFIATSYYNQKNKIANLIARSPKYRSPDMITSSKKPPTFYFHYIAPDHLYQILS